MTLNPNTKLQRPIHTSSGTNTSGETWVHEWNRMIIESDKLREKLLEEDKLRAKLRRKDMLSRKNQQKRFKCL